MQKGVRDMKIDYRIRSVDGYTKNRGISKHAGAYEGCNIRRSKNLLVEQLDLIMQSSGNSIGALLKHIAAIEKVHQLISFQNRDFTKEELEIWEDALYLGERVERSVVMKYSIMYNFYKVFEKNL